MRPVLSSFLLAAATVGSLAVPAAAQDASAPAACQRLAGDGRIGTALALSQAAWQRADTVVLTTYDAWPDALAAAPLAGFRDAPVLYTTTDRLPDGVAAELTRLGTREVVVIGGDRAVSPAVVDQLRAVVPSVVRLAGADRFETAAIVATASGLSAEAGVIVAVGEAGQAAAARAAAEDLPVLLSGPDGLHPSARSAIEALGADRVIGAGLTDAVRADLEAMALYVYGETAPTTVSRTFVAAATRVDLLAAAPYAAQRGAALTLVGRDDAPAAVAGMLAGGIGCDAVVGGTAVLSERLHAELSAPATAPAEPVVTWRTPEGTFATTGHPAEDLERIRAAIAAGGSVGIPNGAMRHGDGGFNQPHPWHMVDVELADMAMEVCDGTADFVTSEVEEFVDNVQRYCPWSALPVAITD